jgi:hypothetical protein
MWQKIGSSDSQLGDEQFFRVAKNSILGVGFGNYWRCSKTDQVLTASINVF